MARGRRRACARTCSSSSPRPTATTRWPTSRPARWPRCGAPPTSRTSTSRRWASRSSPASSRSASCGPRARSSPRSPPSTRARPRRAARTRRRWSRRSTRSPRAQGDDCDAVGDLPRRRRAQGRRAGRHRRLRRPAARADRVRGQELAPVAQGRALEELDAAMAQRDADYGVWVVPSEDLLPARASAAARDQRRQAVRRLRPGGRLAAGARGRVHAGPRARADGRGRGRAGWTRRRCAPRSSARWGRWRTCAASSRS